MKGDHVGAGSFHQTWRSDSRAIAPRPLAPSGQCRASSCAAGCAGRLSISTTVVAAGGDTRATFSRLAGVSIRTAGVAWALDGLCALTIVVVTAGASARRTPPQRVQPRPARSPCVRCWAARQPDTRDTARCGDTGRRQHIDADVERVGRSVVERQVQVFEIGGPHLPRRTRRDVRRATTVPPPARRAERPPSRHPGFQPDASRRARWRVCGAQ